MLLQELREEILQANLELVRRGLVLYRFGNVSGISRADALVAIKPSGVPYEEMEPEHMVVTDLTRKIVEGNLRPSSDLATHLVLYRAFPEIGGVAHTDSEYATAWAQARRPIPCFGTTHADYFHGPVPVTAVMEHEEIASHYERNTGHAIVRAFEHGDHASVPAALVANLGPFTWGEDPASAAHNAVVLESVARMASANLGALVLDWRHPCNAVPRPRDDAFLLHFENAFGSGLPQAAVRGIQPHSSGDLVCIHDVLMSGINMYSMALVMKVVLDWNINFSIWVSSLTVAAYVALGIRFAPRRQE